MGTMMFVMGLAFLGFIVYLTVKQVEFVLKAIPLYQEMVANQKEMISLLKKISLSENRTSENSKAEE